LGGTPRWKTEAADKRIRAMGEDDPMPRSSWEEKGDAQYHPASSGVRGGLEVSEECLSRRGYEMYVGSEKWESSDGGVRRNWEPLSELTSEGCNSEGGFQRGTPFAAKVPIVQLPWQTDALRSRIRRGDMLRGATPLTRELK